MYMFYNIFGKLIDSENDSSKIDKNEIDLQYSTLLNDRILNKIKKMYNNINKSEGLKNIFKNTDKKLENKVNNLNFGYICPGAINTKMQTTIRSVSSSILPDMKKFHEMHDKHMLRSVDDAAASIFNYIIKSTNDNIESFVKV